MTSATRIKICGLTTAADALAAAEHGADAIGLVFHAGSRRCVSLQVAAEIASAVGPFVTLVGLFVDAEPVYVRNVLQAVPLHVLQFHGAETAAMCESFGRPYIKALKVGVPAGESESSRAFIAATHDHLLQQAAVYASAQAILLDTLSSKGEGGTGESFDWRCVPQRAGVHWILAGGLDPDNVRRAIHVARPYAVDVSSGVESAAGVKDAEKIRRFVEQARAAQATHCDQ